MDTAKIGSFIKELRTEKGMTQKQLAEALYITDRAVSKWERGLSAPDISLLEPLAEIFDVSVSEIIAGERSHSAPPDIQYVTKEFIVYSDNEIKTKVVKRKKWAYLKAALLLLNTVFILLTLAEFWGEGFSWRCIPAHISLEKSIHAIENYDKTGIEENIRYSEHMYDRLVSLKDAGIEITDRKSYITDVKLDDGFLFTESCFTVEYDGLTYIFTATGTYRNGKTELMYLLPGVSTQARQWVNTLEDVLCTYYPG